jgi:hypothetical protein
MVIHEVNIESLAILKPENDSPVRAYGDGPKACSVAFQRMKPERRNIEIGDFLSCLHHCQYLFDFSDVLWVDSAWAVIIEKLPQPFVLKGLDHWCLAAQGL